MQRTFRMLAIGLLAALALAVLAAPAAAHDFESSYLYIDVGESELVGRVEVPYDDISTVFGLDLSGSAGEVRTELVENMDVLHAYLLDHTAIGAGGEEWPLEFTGVGLFSDEVGEITGGSGYALFPFVVSVPVAEVPQVLDFTFDPFVDEIEGRSHLVLLRNDVRRGVIDQEANSLVLTDASARSVTVDLGDTSQWSNFGASIELGVQHIRTGPDHIFFILVLLLPSVLVLSKGWRPAPSFRAGLWRVLKVASMFTLAHSITFTLAGLDLLPLPPSRLVEVIIALSITAAALHNIWPVLHEREWLIAFAFGLFHGMGFARVVESLDVSQITQLISLLGRNVGIEVGQVVIILISFPALFLLSRTAYYRVPFLAGSIGLAMVSGVWAVERIASADAGINRWVDRLVRWPRSLLLMIGLTALIAVVYANERRSGRLVAVGKEAT